MQAGEDMAGENNPVALAQAYAQLADLEMEFDQAEAELLKHQIILYEPIYRRRNEVLATIPSFWTNIFVNFGPELDEHITPEDWAFLSENLISVNVSRPDANNNPRSFDIIFGLKENNGVVVTTEVRKSFVYKSLKDGNERWTGLISEPVEIKWVNEDKDLTGGINRLAIKIFELRKKRVEGKIEEKQKKKEDGLNAKGKSASKIKEDDGLSELELELEEKLNQHQSFFNWFSWTGEYFMVLEQEAKAKVKEETTTNGKGLDDEDEDDDDDDDDDDDGDDENEAIDVFPDGIKLAYLIADDMFPNALKHFADAMENNETVYEIDSDGEDGVDFNDAESIELDSDLEEQLMKTSKFGKIAGKMGDKKKRKSDDEMEDEGGDNSRRKKKVRR